MKIAVITTPELARGFALLGAEVYGLENSSDVVGCVHELINREDIGIVMITERYYMQFEDELLKLRLEVRKPVIMDIPDMVKPHKKMKLVSDFVFRNTGVSI